MTIRDNHIWIRNPDDQGAWPTLVNPDDARLTVRIDGEKRISEVVVQEGQRIEVELASKAPTIWFATKVIRHNMEVIGSIHVTYGETYRLREMEDVRRAVLELEIQTVRPEPLGMDKILEHLQSMGYVGTPIRRPWRRWTSDRRNGMRGPSGDALSAWSSSALSPTQASQGL
ncbi:hypothetical protein [Alicyclobacillus acidocaldarius]|uniref:hypothetical protein n=1 Tax=Alicyclobacillus acidocaldarius TaxID=405212 RepID=UPI00145E7D00|nr:hypothetical protein [Alicyclobacillus acidocaldarius]